MEKLQRFSIRKLSIGAVSCMIGTVTFLGYANNVQAAEKPQTVETAKTENEIQPENAQAENEIQPENAQESKPNEEAKGDTQNEAVDKDAVGSQANNVDTNEQNEKDVTLATNSTASETNASSKPVQTVSPEQSADTMDVQPASDQVERAATNKNALENNGSAKSASTVLSKQPANADTQLAAIMSGVQPFVNLAVESDNNDLTPKRETVDSTWTLHYVNQADHKQELKDPTVMTMQYTRTNTPQSDGTTQYGDWSYVPGSFKQTGTPITVKDSDNPVKQDNVDKNGENFDIFTITAMYPTVAGYGFYNGINGTRLHDNLRNNERQADAMSKDFYAEYDVAKPMSDTITSKWTIHYVKYGDHQQELKAPTVITRQYTRTNTLQSNGKIRYGDWSYVPGSFKLTGTPITVNGSDNPTKEDNVDKDGKNYDVFSIVVQHPDITGYELHNATNGVRISDLLQNDDSDGDILIMSPTMNNDRYVEYDVAKERSVSVKFVDDQYFKQQVGQAITLTGHDGDTVKVNVTVPDKYQLANGQQLPTTYTFANGSGDVTIHLVHKVVQREATINFQLGLETFVDFGNNSYEPAVVTQAHWAQLEEEAKNGHGPVAPGGEIPFTEVGTLTGHVGYDLVDEEAVSFGDDWTSLNLGSQTYQMPNGTEVVNGIMIDSDDTMGKKLKEEILNEYRMMNSNKHLDSDYVNRPWHGYLSVNATNNTQTPGADDIIRSGLQAGLAGDESNTLAKATGDRAATAVEMVNKTIDVSWLQDYLNFTARAFSEQDGQLQATLPVPVYGVYVPYVEKTATRTINVTTPDGKTTTVEQTATLAKQVEFGKDAHPAWTTGEWTNYDVPTIPGYTASQSQVAKDTVTGETKDQTVNITYTANPQTTTVVYQTEDGTPVRTTTVNGQTGQTVKVSNEVPAGWKIIDGKVPSEITFGPNETPQTVVTIAHQHVTVKSDAPKTTADHLPDNSNKTYPAGVSESDLNKTITGTIKVTMPDGQVKTVLKTAKLTRTADVDEVTGEVKYSNWTTGYWSAYTAPVVPGYTADVPYIAGQLVTDTTEDQTIEITYTANAQTTHVNYVDAQGKLVHTTTVNGHTNQTVEVPNEIPDGWKLVDGQTVPNTITFGPDGHADMSVKIEHQHVTVTPDKPQANGTELPDNPKQSFHDVEASDLNKTVTRTIKVTTPTGKTNTIKQEAKLTRTATVDEVTGDVSYGDWSIGKWDAYQVPSLNGYTATQPEVAATSVNENTTNQTVDVSYTPNKQSTVVKYVDDDNQVVHTTTVNGVTDQTVKVPNEVPAGWMITKGQVPSEITFDTDGHEAIEVTVVHRHVTVDPTDPKNPTDTLPDNSAKNYPAGVSESDLNKTITRTIKITQPDGTATNKVQTVKLTRTADVDEVTGEVTYGKWTTGQWDAYEIPSAKGYTASQASVAAMLVTSDTKDQTVEVSYTANKQSTTIKYVDDKGQVVYTTTINGVTDQTVKVPSEVPAGWMITKGKVPNEITFGVDGHEPIEITVDHRHITVDPAHPQTNGTKLPDNPAKIFDGVEANDLNKTITRTIKITQPDGQIKTVTQTAKLTRTADVDEVTGEVTHGKWTTGQWDSYEIPALKGYTPSQASVEATPVDESTKDQTVNITYTANKQSTAIKYVDDKGNVVHTTTVDGVTDQTVKVPNEVPAGWMIAKGQVPSEITFSADGHEAIEVTVAHRHVTVTPDQPQNNGTKLPDNPAKIFNGVEANDLNRTVTRTIKVTTPDGQTETVAQTAKLTRTADVDEVTGEITYGDWTTDEWVAYDAPSVAGYVPNQTKVDKETVTAASKDMTTTITYLPTQHQISVEYVDDDDHGKVIKTDQITGKTDEKVKVTPDVPDGYVLKGEVPSEVTIKPDDTPITVTVEHGKSHVTPDKPVNKGDLIPGTKDKHYPEGLTHDDLNKTITREITITDPTGKKSTTTQTVTFTRGATVDEVTNKVTYDAWSENGKHTFGKVDVPTVQGYTASGDVPGLTVTPDSQSINVTVTYNANTQTAKITYIDDTTTTNLDSKDTSGKFGQAITFATTPADEIENYKKQGYVLVSSTFDNNKYQADNSNNVFYVHLKHDTKDVSRTDDVNMTVHYVMDDNSEAPSDNKQTLSFTENGIQDLVTKHIDWTPAASQTLKDVASPVLTGYTVDIKTANGKVVNFDDPDINVTVTYHANTQTATITYIDDTTKNNLDSKAISGKFGQAITFATAPTDEIANYKKQGYKLVSNDFNDNKYQADNNKNVFHVHFIHDTKNVSRNDDVKMTVHYVMDDGSKAPSDSKQTVSFTESGIKDNVTGNITWMPVASQTLKDVDSPVLTGYTADIKTANGKVVNFGDSDINVTVHYSANTQNAKITYIDDTEKKTLSSDNRNGKFNQVIAFEHDPAEVIKGFEEKGYVFVSDSFDHQKYQADNNSNVFEVHFIHGTKNVSRTDDVNMTVHYVMDDNSEAPSDNKQAVNFTENGIQDLVTKHIDWTPAVSQTFKDVVTPKVAGYTPDQDKVAGQTVNFGDNDVEVTVTYLPDVQLGHINYIDDNTGKTLTRDDFSGRTNEHEDYTSIDRIQEFENKGYVFVSSDYPDGGFNFDDNDQQDQVFNVHLKHGIVTVTSKNPQIPNTTIDPDPHSPKYPEDISNTNSDVKRTTDYKFKDDKTAQPTVTDNLHFERTVVIDKVTGKVLSDTWTPSQNFSDIQTPAIQGYTSDRTVVSDKNIGHDHQDIIEHVVYSPDAQHMAITYIDDTTGKTLHTDKRDGVSDQDAKYTTSNTIKQYIDSHYKLVSDSTKGQDLIFDHDDNADQTYEVHFVHGKHAISQTTSPKQTIHYVYADGLVRQGKAADDNIQTLSFKRDGYNDEVTGTDHWNAWIPANSNYSAVDSPVIQGYTADKLVVEKSTVNPTDKDTEITVTYNADRQAARVIYIDKTTNTTLVSKDLSGKSDEDSEYNTKDTIGQYQSQHYVLAGDETNGDNVIFDHDDQQDQTYYVYFVHGTQKVNRQSAVTSTIVYKFEDGKTAQPTVTQTKYFSEDGVKDLVTGKIVWNEAESQKFDDIATKSIVGYTPDKDEVAGSTVKFGDSDIEVTVTYHNNAQKAVITYIDDMTNNTLASDSQDGKFDHEIAFSHKPNDVISGFEKAGYKLVSNNFKDGTKYKADDKQNEFIVHLTHDKQKVNRQDQVIETIHYVYENGSKSQPDHEQTISFTEDGVKDKVTGQITWTPADSQKFDDVVTPKMTGYTPDTYNVVGSTVKFGDDDIEVTVTYHNNAQTAKITYIDDTEKKTLGSDSQDGKFNHVITFEHDPVEVINGLKEKGYKLVSNDFNNNNYQADNSKNVFYVHFVHGSHDISDKKAITEIITYIMSDGSKAPDKVEKQVEFSRDGYNDEVTKQDHWNKWQPDKQSFDAVQTPDVTGYTPDIKSVEAKTVTAGDKDITVAITYSPNKQKAKVVFIDDTTKKILDTHDLTGVTNSHEKYNPSEEIDKFVHENYVFVSSDYPEKGFTYDNDDNHDQVFEVHLKEVPIESDTPTIPDNTEDNGGSNDTPTDSDNPEKDNGGSDTDKSNHKTPVKRHDHKKHHGTKKTNKQKNANKTNIPKTSKTAKLNSNRFAQPKLEKAKESTNRVNRIKHDALPQTGEKRSSLMAMLGLAISGLGMIGAMKSKKRKDD